MKTLAELMIELNEPITDMQAMGLIKGYAKQEVEKHLAIAADEVSNSGFSCDVNLITGIKIELT